MSDNHSLEGIASLLDLLDLESSGRLINLPREERRRVLARFDRMARKLSLRGALPVPARVYSRLLRLGEEVLERQRQFAEAAVLYALAQDDCLEGDDDFAGLRILFRFKVGHALHLGEKGETNFRLVGFTYRTIAALKDLESTEKIPSPMCRVLMYKLENWLGWKFKKLGELRLAIHSYLAASSEADEPYDRAACLLEVASLHEKLGEDQQAFQWLQQCSEDLKEVENEEIKQRWELSYGSLQARLGGSPTFLAKNLKTPLAQMAAESMRRGLAEGVLSATEMISSAIDKSPLADESAPDLRHRGLLQRALLSFALGEVERAQALLAEAEDLEERLPGAVHRLRREVLLARWESQSGDPGDAARRFSAILPGAEVCFAPDERIEVLGHSLEALWKSGCPEEEAVLSQTEDLLLLVEDRLARCPGSAARRRIRDLNQRYLESALCALIELAERLQIESDKGQSVLARAWALIMASRNPELRTVSRDFADKREVYRLTELEDEFHAALRLQIEQDPQLFDGPACWEEPLERLQEYEISVVRAPRPRSGSSSLPPRRGIALAFFQIRDLLRTELLLVLVSDNGRLDVCKTTGAEEGHMGDGPAWPWLPLSLTLPTWGPPPTWSIFPDGKLLHTTPVEILVIREDPKIRLGERVPVRLCLRSSVPDREARVSVWRGWLGLGGVPQFPGMHDLPASREEVLALRETLGRQGVPTSVLLDEGATAANLARRLAALRPAVIHIAAHGVFNEEHPEACALILAPDPASSCNELLPFRRILDLPLEGIELVVLSACSSLIGASGRSAGMEGLAWAFLQAGVGQVIASRGDANDEATSSIMRALYRHLLEHPVAEALRRTRLECQEDWKREKEMALWSVWS